MRVCIHRGSKEIGGSCVEIESAGQRLLIDFGLPLDAQGDSAQYLPKISGLDGNDDTLLGILVSHPHLDHFGLLAHVSPKVKVGIGPDAKNIIEAAAHFLRDKRPISLDGWVFQSNECIQIGPFLVTPYLVDHSAYDSYAFKIESDGKTLFYSGDFRGHGRKPSLFKEMIANPPQNVDVLIMEGTSLGRMVESDEATTEAELKSVVAAATEIEVKPVVDVTSEADVQMQLAKALSITPGLALVHASAQNIDRIVSIFKACKNTKRKLVIDLYAAAILEATGNVNIPQSYWSDVVLYVPYKQSIQIKNNAWFDLLKKHSTNRINIDTIKKNPNKFTLLFRPMHCSDLEKAHCLEGARYIYSLWEGYWDMASSDSVKDWLTRNNIPKQSIHTSGHANIEHLKKMVLAMNPAALVPIHTFMPEKFSELFANVQIHDDKAWWEVV